ncbi:MAG: FAD-dependent oxidoreductase [Deltaproteobacteria bacterium]|nr:FAD-dependent oxidoreductase [Deltaproteobacteria bacterium]
MTAPTVIVIGGGIGGLTAAHELVERGFQVTVYETRAAWGGKARSQPVAGTATGGREELPGEHGFRFYPRFYRHVIDTMSRIPSGTGMVVDHLRATTEAAIALVDDYTWYRFARKRIDTPYSLVEALEIFFQNLDFDDQDVVVFTLKLLEFATSCEARRLGEYEQLSWWEFLQAGHYSTKFQNQLRAIPRMMVAMDAQKGSARTVGSTTLQLLGDFAYVGAQNDRTMGGPTTKMWIDPWTSHLAARGVTLHAGTSVLGLDVTAGKVSGIQLAGGGTATADYYVLAAPIDGAIQLLAASPGVTAIDPVLATLATQRVDALVEWMVGIQFYLYEDLSLVRGHMFFPDSPWALTSISQPQFWRDLGLFRRVFGDGSVGGLISVDISEWNTPGKFILKTAKECTPAEIAAEVWGQLKSALNGLGATVLTDDLLHSWHLDDDVDYSAGTPPTNASRLLVHPPGSWSVRPEAVTAIPNLVIASDYVRTHTNIASMEGACEAGRRAANGILRASGSTAAIVDVWPLVESPWFDFAKRRDAARYARGKPHLFQSFGIQRLVRGAAQLRTLETMLGFGKLDDFFDRYKWTTLIRSVTSRLGL